MTLNTGSDADLWAANMGLETDDGILAEVCARNAARYTFCYRRST